MVQVGYYPGCALEGTAAEYDESLRAVCQALDIRLAELEDWNCCGASSAHCLDEELALQLAERNLQLATQVGPELLAPCAACFQRLKTAQKRRPSYEVVIWHVNEFFAQPGRLAELRRRLQQPLRGLVGVPYYGCLTQRQPKITDAAQPEWPTSMDVLMEAIGMEVGCWSYKTDCCGGSLQIPRPDLVQQLCGRLVWAAQEAGAECIVTACPLCQANLDISQMLGVPVGGPYQLFGSQEGAVSAGANSAKETCSSMATEPRSSLWASFGAESVEETSSANAMGPKGSPSASACCNAVEEASCSRPAGGGSQQAICPADRAEPNRKLPVFYITELMALALGVGQPARWWQRHLVDVRPLLREKGFYFP
ncbi:MAG: heterodisulfide reductase-related iron-sulfur binding cluster [Thermoguttaceae bacterium]|nr:heterodisulfide reductase-related iron-sulfur binding cluster [Thermoguttaceae bacterium]MDW8036693.1 heterodisulfide reductase-related iron-sulfur binding cluster [Thermoguttaceae bacterium]